MSGDLIVKNIGGYGVAFRYHDVEEIGPEHWPEQVRQYARDRAGREAESRGKEKPREVVSDLEVCYLWPVG